MPPCESACVRACMCACVCVCVCVCVHTVQVCLRVCVCVLLHVLIDQCCQGEVLLPSIAGIDPRLGLYYRRETACLVCHLEHCYSCVIILRLYIMDYIMVWYTTL